MTGIMLKCLVLALFICGSKVLADLRVEGVQEDFDSMDSDSASTLAFVFDVTGSMYDDLKQVIEGASRILEKTLNRRTRPIKNFVLVPFHDPDIGPVSITTDPKKFQQDLQELFVQGGGDCPEMSVGAIKKALEVSLPGSFIYVFTDARAKDYHLKRDVLQLVQLRQSQVVFVLTGDCGDRSQPGYRAYEEIAATSSGQIFHLNKQQVNEVLKWVEETVQGLKVHLLSSNHDSAQENQWEVPFDPSLKEFTVSLSGPAPQIELRDPLGTLLEQGLTELLNIPNSARVVNLKFPRPGSWTLKVGCGGRHTLRVTGVSNLDFRAGFSSIPVSEFNYTRERPIKGVPAHVLLKCTGLKPPGQLSHMELVSGSGRSLRTLPVPLPSDRGSRGLWSVPEFRTPSQSFFLKVTGKDEEGYRFQRLSSVSYTNIIPDPPAVSMPLVVNSFYMQPAMIGCSVESDVPYRLRFTRSGVSLGEDKFSGKASWEIPHASGEDEGPYECIAQSSAGLGRALTQLTVREPPPVLKAPVNVSSTVGAVAVLACQVEGSMRHNLTWQRAGLNILTRSGRVRVLPNSFLEISGLRPQDAGQYQCVATNAHGDSRVTVWLLVPEAPSVVVSPQSQAFSRGSEVHLICTVSGSPTPQLFWSHGNIFLTNQPRMAISKHGGLTIRDALPEDAGNYTCLATNEAGTAKQTVSLNYAEEPSIWVAKQVVMVAVGGDATLACQATGVPPPLVKWSKGDLQVGSVPFAEQDVHRGTLQIRGVQEKDAGEYSCVARNPAGTSSATVILEVGAAPLFSETPVDMMADVGENVTLPCVAHGFPLPKVTWRRDDGRPILTNVDSSGSHVQLEKGHLLIQSVWLDDEGVYVCEAKNQFGTIRTEARVSVSGLGMKPPFLAHGAPVITTGIGQSLSIPCMLLDGIPLPERHWTHNGNEVRMTLWSIQGYSRFSNNDGYLHILNPTAEDAGIYICTATSAVGYASREIQLSVNTKPKIVGVSSQENTVKMAAEVGSEVILPCEVQGSPSPLVTWSRNGQPIPPVTAWFTVLPSGSLKITDVRLVDSKLYTCSAKNPAGNKQTLFVCFPAKPKIQAAPSLLKALIGQTVVLPCVVQGEPSPEISWFHDGSPVWAKDTGALKIHRASLTDQGIYSCVAKNTAGQDTMEIKLEVLEAPSFAEAGDAIMEKVSNSKVTIPCPAEGRIRFMMYSMSNPLTTLSAIFTPAGSPPPKVRWFKNGLEIHPDQSELSVAQDGSLVIGSASASHSGDFTCVASNDAGSMMSVSRTPLVPPEIQDDGQPLNLTVTLKQPLTLGCDVIGIPSPTITWTKDGVLSKDGDPHVEFHEQGQVMKVKAVRLRDQGLYQCLASNSAGTQMRQFRLTVQGTQILQYTLTKFPFSLLTLLLSPPVFPAPPTIRGPSETSEVSVVLGFPTVLPCDVEGSPMPSITWLKDNQPIVSSAQLTYTRGGQALRLGAAQGESAGLYTCRASNPAGTTLKHYSLSVLGKGTRQGEGDSTSLNFGSRDEKVRINGSLTLSCLAKGFPEPKTQWFKDGQVGLNSHTGIRESGHLIHIDNAMLSHEGQYTCMVTNTAGEDKRDFHVTIQGEEVVLGHPISLSCESNAIPPPHLSWYREGRKLSTADGVVLLPGERGTMPSRSSSTISNWQGRTACTLTWRFWVGTLCYYPCYSVNLLFNHGPRTVKSLNASTCKTDAPFLNVFLFWRPVFPVPPVITGQLDEFMEEIGAVVNSTVALHCDVTGHPEPAISWLRDGTPLPSGQHHSISEDGRQLQVRIPYTKALHCLVQYKDFPWNRMAPVLRWYGAHKYKHLFKCHIKLISTIHTGRIDISCECVYVLAECELMYSRFSPVPPRMVAGREEEVSVIKGHMVSMLCDVQAYPPPEITWTRDGQVLQFSTGIHILPGGQMLQLPRARLEDAGQYVCTATNSAGQDQKSILLMPPSISGETSAPREVQTTQDSVVTLECQAAGIPPPQISWLRNGRPLLLSPRIRLLSADTVLRISPVQLSDSGVYTCVARSRAGLAELNFDVQVQVPPGVDHVEPVKQVTVVRGSLVTLTCEAQGIPPPSLKWLKDGQPLSLHRNLLLDGQETRLQLPDVGLSDRGLYSCVASNQAGSSTKSFNLTVLEPPKISISSPEELMVAVNTALELECTAEGVPSPTLSWLKDGRPLQGDSEIVEEDGHFLRITKVQVSHKRKDTAFNHTSDISVVRWRMQVYTPVWLAAQQARMEVTTGSVFKVIHVFPSRILSILLIDSKVLINQILILIINACFPAPVPPTLLGSDDVRTLSVPAKGHLTLECQADSDPPPDIEWYKDDVKLQVRLDVMETGWQESHNILSDAGRYYCTVSNQAGSDHHGMDLRVFVGPSINPGPFNVTVTTGVRAVLSCEATGIPAPKVTWKRNGTPIDLNQQSGTYRLLSSGSLVLFSPSNQDEGYFECTADNEVGEERTPPTIEDDITTVIAIKMAPVVLPCHAQGRPEPSVSWTKSGAKLGSRGGSYRVLPTGVLEITAATPSHAGRYTCSARNPAGVAHKHITLTVQEPPEIRPMTEEVQVVLHHGTVLPCEVKGFPRPSITWQREGVPILTGHRLALLSNGALKFSRVTLGDAGTYQCLAQNEAGTAMGRTRLVLQVPPVLSVPRVEYTAVLGQPVSLECVADGQPQPEVSWHRERRPVTEGAHIQLFANGTLRIAASQRSDAGLYTCSAKNLVGRASHDMRLVIMSEWIGTEGFQALLPCAAQGLPDPRVSWEKDDNTVPNLPGKFTVLRSGELIIERAEPGDGGVFTCVATNTAGTARQDTRLSVNMRPAFKELPGDVTLNKGQSLSLSCHGQGTPTPVISWTANNSPYPGSSVDEAGRSSLVIENVTMSDAGTYVCLAENSVGTIRALSFVRVYHVSLEPPVLKGEAHISQTVAQGGTAMLDCPVQGNPSPVLRWLRDGRPLLHSLRLQPLHNGSLAIYSVTRGDAGEYQCVAESEAGVAERTVSLKIQIKGGYSNWEEWGPCSTTCGRGVQERIRLCNNPEPVNGGRSCDGPSMDSRRCQTGLCPVLYSPPSLSLSLSLSPLHLSLCLVTEGEAPRKARGSLIGMVNDREFGVSFLEVNITEDLEEGTSTLQAHLDNIPPSVGPLLRALVSVFAPIYWTTVLQTGAARNGYSLTQGLFRQESQLEFDTGESLRLTHVARGLDSEGVLLMDIVINGFVPPTLSTSHLNLQFDESYVQTGPGQLYSWSSQAHQRAGGPMVLRCNHSIIYEGREERQGPLLQLLKVSQMSGIYSIFTLSLDFQMTASLLLPDGDGETCPKGFVLDTASYCADEDECAAESPCSHSCNNVMGGFSCACPSGFTISPKTNTCQDIDECAQASHMCHYNQQCVNTVGTYRCQAKCGPGFKPSAMGTSCEDVDECQESSLSPCQQQCLNTLGSFRCVCNPGYQLSGHRCLDINECSRNVCPAHQQCRNTEGGYQCFDSCPAGMRMGENGACVDVDECQDGSHMCRYSQMCQNTIGGYGCVCPRGYRSQGVGRPYVDECLQTPSPCAHQCRNVPGSFRCLCPPGTVLLGDGRSCAGLERGQAFSNGTRIRERLRPQLVSSLGRPILSRHHGVSRITRQSCPIGYTNRDGTCVGECYVDECLLRKPCQHECRNTIGSIQCGHNQMCFNTRGGHQCLDTPCPASYQKGGSPGPCSWDCASGGSPLLLQYKLLTLPLGILANHNVVRLGIIFTLRPLQRPGLVRLRVQATTLSTQGRITYQSIFIIYISISRYPY
uniref:Hemicentin 2 n=1 Tax=Oncorhynchus tshawytscha TaxID=74940 RepID=A0A8C8M5M0_ONCTS